MKKAAARILLLLFTFLCMLPVKVYAENKTPQPVKPYDRIVAKSGSWYIEQVVAKEGVNLVVGYTGGYKSLQDKPEMTFALSEKTIIKGICLPYAKTLSGPVSIRLEDNAGNVYGDFPTQVFPVEDKNPIIKNKSEERRANYIFSSESGVVLPGGQYTMILSDYDGAVGGFIIKGVNFQAFEQYKEDLKKWEEQNKEESTYDFTGTYNINLDAYKTSTLMGKVSDKDSDFALKDFELTVLNKEDKIELIGKYEEMPFSMECRTIERNKTGIVAEARFLANIANAKYSAVATVTLTGNIGLNPEIDIKGTAIYQRSAGGGKGADYNTYDIVSDGFMKNRELPAFVITALGKQGNAGNIPGPDNAAQAAVGILFPPLVGVFVSVVQELTKPKMHDKAWYKQKNPGLTDNQIAMVMLADAMGSTDNPDEGDAVSVGDNEIQGGGYETEDNDAGGYESEEIPDGGTDSVEDNSSGENDAAGKDFAPVTDAYTGTGPDGETIVRYPDGTLEITMKSGDTVTRYPDGSATVKTAGENMSVQDTKESGPGGEEEVNYSDLLRTADIIGNIYGLSGVTDKAKDLAKVMKEGLGVAAENLRDAFAKGESDDAIKTFLKMNKWSNTADKLSQVANGISKGFEFAGMGIDTLNNMQDLNREDGSLISGDGVLKALGKSILVNKLVSAIGEKNPAVVGMEILNSMALGGTQAGDIISPINNLKGAMNALIDGITDPQLALDRALAGGYGQNLKNLTDGMSLAKDALSEPGKFFDELGQVGNDKAFFEGMYDTAGKMFRDENGNIGKIGAAGEAAAQMGVAMAETAAGVAKMTGEISGHIYESVSSKIQSFFTW